MDTSFPAKLEIVSLQLAEKTDDDFLSSISLMKVSGMQNFGQIKFQIDKEYTEYAFSDQKIIKFFYAPRLTTRRDVVFRIILTDLQSKEQMGDITISTHMLSETFMKDPHAVIEDTKEFFQGVSLHFKIYQPDKGLQIGEKESIFNQSHNNDFISNLFARPEIEDHPIVSKVEKKISASAPFKLKPLPFSSQKQDLVITQRPKEEEREQELDSMLQISSIKPPLPTNRSIDSTPQIRLTDSMTETDSPQKKQPAPQSVSQPNNMNLSTAQLHSSQPLNRLFGMVRQSTFQQLKKKHTLSSKAEVHHTEFKLSIKLKIVIFLLVFGFFMTIFDIYQDKQEQRVIRRIRKSKLGKLKARNKNVH